MNTLGSGDVTHPVQIVITGMTSPNARVFLTQTTENEDVQSAPENGFNSPTA